MRLCLQQAGQTVRILGRKMNYLVEDFLEESKEPSLCLDCFIKLKVGVTDAEKRFLLSEEVSTLMNQKGMYFEPGTCTECRKGGEVIACHKEIRTDH
jgi:hypothetical protein